MDFLNGNMPGYVDTGLNVVDVEDVAQGHLLAATYGKIGEKYILGNENLTLRQILQLLADLTGRPAPRLKVPYALALGVAYGDAALARLIPGREPFAPPVGVRLSKKKMFFSPAKAIGELGLPQTPCGQLPQGHYVVPRARLCERVGGRRQPSRSKAVAVCLVLGRLFCSSGSVSRCIRRVRGIFALLERTVFYLLNRINGPPFRSWSQPETKQRYCLRPCPHSCIKTIQGRFQ